MDKTIRVALVGLLVACSDRAPWGSSSSTGSAVAGSTSAAQASASSAPADSASSPAATVPPIASSAPSQEASKSSECPDGMVLAEGRYCPEVEQKCLKHSREWEEAEKRRAARKKKGEPEGVSHVSERCLRFAETKCLSSERRPMRFCIDRYEWPNVPGEKPAFMVTWTTAKELCTKVDKRLCTADEFNFACEGESMLPYSYGLARDAERCNIDKPYVVPRFKLLPHDLCLESQKCKAHMEELDQREPSGARTGCSSPFGAFDINGNVNEWVERPKETAPWRSGLKGGWWGPSRSRCRPMVTAHDENYVGYEVGFRCCKDAVKAP